MLAVEAVFQRMILETVIKKAQHNQTDQGEKERRDETKKNGGVHKSDGRRYGKSR